MSVVNQNQETETLICGGGDDDGSFKVADNYSGPGMDFTIWLDLDFPYGILVKL